MVSQPYDREADCRLSRELLKRLAVESPQLQLYLEDDPCEFRTTDVNNGRHL